MSDQEINTAWDTHLNKDVCSNEANMLVQHHPTMLDATICWPCLNTMLDDVGQRWLEFKLA